MKILFIDGPNLDLLGIREPDIYGSRTHDDLVATITEAARERNVSVGFYQSNYEGGLVVAIHKALFDHYDGIVINPAAYTHTSVAILDAVKAVGVPTVEVHISDVDTREEFRKVSYLRPACIATVSGKGFDGYIEAMDILIKNAKEQDS